MTKVLTTRYERFVNAIPTPNTSGIITHATTNLLLQAIKLKYEVRFFDRCKQLFNIVLFEGESRRK